MTPGRRSRRTPLRGPFSRVSSCGSTVTAGVSSSGIAAGLPCRPPRQPRAGRWAAAGRRKPRSAAPLSATPWFRSRSRWPPIPVTHCAFDSEVGETQRPPFRRVVRNLDAERKACRDSGATAIKRHRSRPSCGARASARCMSTYRPRYPDPSSAHPVCWGLRARQFRRRSGHGDPGCRSKWRRRAARVAGPMYRVLPSPSRRG